MDSATSRRTSTSWCATAIGRSSPPKYPMMCSIFSLLWGTFGELPEKVAARFGGISDTVGVEFSPQSEAAAVSALVEKLRAIPSRFTAFSDKWANAPT